MKRCLSKTIASLTLSLVMVLSVVLGNPAPAMAWTHPAQYSAESRKVMNQCYTFFMNEMGLSAAETCGILANIDYECDFDPADESYAGGNLYYGLFQIGFDRLERMRSFCTANKLDISTAEAQLKFMQYEVGPNGNSYERSQFNKFLDACSSYGNTAEGAYYAALYFATYVERCAERVRQPRAVLARDDFWPLYGAVKNLACCQLTVSSSVTYTGSAAVPSVTVTDNGSVLKQDTDYTVSCRSNTDYGTATVTVTGRGEYTGTLSANYTVKAQKSELSSAPVNTNSGIQVSWRSIPAVTGYAVYRIDASGTMSRIATVSAGTLTYVDKTAQAGHSYSYTVRAYKTGCSTSLFPYDSTGKKVVRLTAPTLGSTALSSKGITVKWKASAGAKEYQIYRKSSTATRWTLVGTVTSDKLSWTDTETEHQMTYTYTVRAAAGSDISSYDAHGISQYFVAYPRLVKTANMSSGLKIYWNAVSGASAYRIFRKGESGSWTQMAELSGSRLNWTDTSAAAGKTYTYTVRAKVNSQWSSYDSTGITAIRLNAPKLVKTFNNTKGIYLRWEQTAGAQKYQIYRRTGSSTKWELVETVDGSKYSWTDTSATNGTAYHYTVRAEAAVGKTQVLSYYDTKGLTMIRLAPVTISKMTTVSGGIKLYWLDNSKATGYQIMYSQDETFKTAGTVTVPDGTKTARYLSKLSGGKTYYVRIRSYHTAGGTDYFSAWSETASILVAK